MQKTQELLEVGSTCQMEQGTVDVDGITITKTVDCVEIPSCTYDVNKITNSVKVKKQQASLEVKKKAPKHKRFTKAGDTFLKAGIEKYGCKNWTSILKDDQFLFHESRN